MSKKQEDEAQLRAAAKNALLAMGDLVESMAVTYKLDSIAGVETDTLREEMSSLTTSMLNLKQWACNRGLL